MSDHGPRYATVGDYLRVMRRRRLLIAIIVVVFVAAALGLSLTRQTEYTAETRISFRDPLQDLVLISGGGQIFPDISPAQRATIQADLLTSNEVASRVKKELETDLSPGSLAGAISTRVAPQTNLVTVSAIWPDANFAAKLANAFAGQAARLGEADARDRLADAERALQSELRDARQKRPPAGIRISIAEQNLQRIQGLQRITKPAEVLQEAQPPTSPSSPQTARNTVLGAILGLVFAIVAAFIRDALDRRLHNAQEVHEEFGLPILGRIGATSFAYSGLAANGLPAPIESEFEAFRVLRMNLGFLGGEKQPPRSVLVASPMPQEGKSTVSIALASAAALTGASVLLVECDLRRPSFTRRLSIPREPGLTDYLRGTAQPADILRVVNLRSPRSLNGEAPPQSLAPTPPAVPTTNVVGKVRGAVGKPSSTPVTNENQKVKDDVAGSMVVIPAGTAITNAPELLQGDRFESFLEKVSRAYDLVILDGSPLLSVADPLELVSDADAVLLCVRVQQTTRDQVRAARSALSHLPERPCGVVVTGLRRGDETYEYYYGY